MLRSRTALLSVLRAAVLVAAAGALLAADSLHLRGVHNDIVRGLLLLFAVGVFLPRSVLMRPVAPLLLLAADVLAVGAAGTFLRVPEGPGASAVPSVPFLAGFLVAELVAVTGRRVGAAVVGALAGWMILGLGESALAKDSTPPDDLLLGARAVLVLASAVEGAIITAWIDADVRRRRTAASIDREMKARDAVASEMSTYLATATSAASLPELAEALVQHLRRHVPTRARAVVLESGGDSYAIWEEATRLSDDLVEQRRKLLQEAMREGGSMGVLGRVEARSTSDRPPAKSERFATAVGIAVHAGGRAAGVIYVADPKRRALPEERLSALAEAARGTGDSILRLERRRDEQTRRTALLLGQMREGVLLLGPDARVLLSNPAGREALKVLQRPMGAPVALGEAKPEELASVPPATVRRWTVTAPSAGGRAVTMAVAAVGVADGGVRLGTLVTLTDITEEEAARRRLMHAEKLSVVGQTLAGVAHELNNPLAAIVGYSDLLAESDVAPEVERLLVRVREQATRASRIVKNLLSVVRKRGPERTHLSLNEVVQSVVDLFAYDARLSNIVLLPLLDPDLPAVLADKHAVQQVLVNLVQNAIHALRGKQSGGRVEIRTAKERGHVTLAVRDDGPGITAENRTKLFEAFFTTKGPDEGTGLGLAISRGIARDHGGDLVLEPGGPGATFTLRIPLPEHAPAKDVEARFQLVPEDLPGRVLVEDDEAPVRESLAAQLGRLGTHVDTAGTPLEASRCLAAGEVYDAVLMDVRLPGTTGIDLHRALKARCPELAARVVFMTGDLVNDDVIRAVKETGNPLLEKPFSFEELREALGKVTAGAANADRRQPV